MARKRRGDNEDDNPEQKLPEDSPTPRKAERAGGAPRAGRARPGPQARAPKAGSVTKAVQQGRVSRFTQEVVAELKKVSWPTRPQLLQATAVVIVAVAIIAVFLGLADEASDRIVDFVF
jgi:preprotein translocase subunit SecE